MKLFRVSDSVTIVPKYVAAVRRSPRDDNWPEVFVTMAMGQEVCVKRWGREDFGAEGSERMETGARPSYELIQRAQPMADDLYDRILAAVSPEDPPPAKVECDDALIDHETRAGE